MSRDRRGHLFSRWRTATRKLSEYLAAVKLTEGAHDGVNSRAWETTRQALRRLVNLFVEMHEAREAGDG